MYQHIQTQLSLPRERRMAKGLAWVCPECKVWWGSQVGKRPSTNFLIQLADSGQMPFDWDAYRGWKHENQSENTCPECGRQIAEPTVLNN